jgi:hypothetical protein
MNKARRGIFNSKLCNCAPPPLVSGGSTWHSREQYSASLQRPHAMRATLLSPSKTWQLAQRLSAASPSSAIACAGSVLPSCPKADPRRQPTPTPLGRFCAASESESLAEILYGLFIISTLEKEQADKQRV